MVKEERKFCGPSEQNLLKDRSNFVKVKNIDLISGSAKQVRLSSQVFARTQNGLASTTATLNTNLLQN